MMKHSNLEHAEKDLHRLLIEISNVSDDRLDEVGKTLDPPASGDIVQGILPLFMRKTYALYEEKQRMRAEERERGKATAARYHDIQCNLLYEMLSFFANVAVPPHLVHTSVGWEVCHNFEFIFRRVDTGKSTEIPVRPDRKKLH